MKKNVELLALIDSGAAGIFIDPTLVKKYSLPSKTLPRPLEIRNADGSTNNQGICTRYCTLTITVDHKVMEIKPKITSLGSPRLILGLPWLVEHNPEIDWAKGTLRWRKEPGNCVELNELIDSLGEEPIFDDEMLELNDMNLKDYWTEINAKTTSSHLIARQNVKAKAEDPKKVVPPEYHNYLSIFNKKASEHFPPKRDHRTTRSN